MINAFALTEGLLVLTQLYAEIAKKANFEGKFGREKNI